MVDVTSPLLEVFLQNTGISKHNMMTILLLSKVSFHMDVPLELTGNSTQIVVLSGLDEASFQKELPVCKHRHLTACQSSCGVMDKERIEKQIHVPWQASHSTTWSRSSDA